MLRGLPQMATIAQIKEQKPAAKAWTFELFCAPMLSDFDLQPLSIP